MYLFMTILIWLHYHGIILEHGTFVLLEWILSTTGSTELLMVRKLLLTKFVFLIQSPSVILLVIDMYYGNSRIVLATSGLWKGKV